MKVSFRSSKSTKPTEDQGFRVGYGAAKRTGYAIRWYFIVFVIVSPIIGFLYYGATKTLLVTAKGILTTEPLNLKVPESGTVKAIHTKVGDQIVEDQTIMVIQSPTLEKRAENLRINIALMAQNNTTAQKKYLELGQARVNTARENLDKQLDFDVQYKAYKQQGIIPLSEQVQLQDAKTNAKLKLLQARQEYHVGKGNFLAGPTAQGIFLLDQELTNVQAMIDQLVIKAPHNAQVNELFVQVGDYVTDGEELASITSREAPVVIAYIDPSDMDYSYLGQTATVTFPNGSKYEAEIKEPTQLANKIPAVLASPFDGSKPALKVILTFDKPIERMIEGLPVDVRFHYLGQHDNFISTYLSWIPFLVEALSGHQDTE